MIRYTAPGVDAYYEYDASRRRISKTVNGVTTLFSWEGSRLIAELDENQRIQRRWVYRGYTPLAMVVYHYGTGPAPTGHTTYYYISDANGTAWGLTDSSGTVVWSADYDSYGNATFSGTIDQPLRMPGQYHDTESGLYYNLARYYEPTTGRYLSVDPLRDAEDYTYAGGNPLKYVDIDGLTLRLSRQLMKDKHAATKALILKDLGRLIGGTVTADQNGILSVCATSSNPLGTSLLNSLIASSIVVTIGLESAFFEQTSRSTSGHALAVSVGYALSTPQLYESSDSGLILNRVDSSIALGHELIHAYRNIQSSRTPLKTSMTSVAYTLENGQSFKQEESLEELIVIGNRPGSLITENGLRREQGVLPRFGHRGEP